MNKHEERYYAEKTAKTLKILWKIERETESPDFIVTEGDRQFGLEVSELFTGSEGRKGSKLKAEESARQRTINLYRKQYEEESNIPLSVRIRGPVNDETMSELLDHLLQCDFESMELGKQIAFQQSEQFKADAAKTRRSWWFRIDDFGGWVNTNAVPIIDKRVEEKSGHLPRYRESVGDDVRLLLVANRLFNSGRLELVENAKIVTRGFGAVYFLSYPESVTELSETADDKYIMDRVVHRD